MKQLTNWLIFVKGQKVSASQVWSGAFALYCIKWTTNKLQVQINHYFLILCCIDNENKCTLQLIYLVSFIKSDQQYHKYLPVRIYGSFFLNKSGHTVIADLIFKSKFLSQVNDPKWASTRN